MVSLRSFSLTTAGLCAVCRLSRRRSIASFAASCAATAGRPSPSACRIAQRPCVYAAATAHSRLASVAVANWLLCASGTVHAVATPRSPRASGGADDMLAGCLRDVFRSIDAAAPIHSRRASAAVAKCSPGASGRAPESSTPTLRTCSPAASKHILRTVHAVAAHIHLLASGGHRGSSAVHLRGHPGTVDAAATLPSRCISVAVKNGHPRA